MSTESMNQISEAKKKITAHCFNSCSGKDKKKTYQIEIDEHAFNILLGLKFEPVQGPDEPVVESTFSEVIEMLWDDYCEGHGEPDREVG